VLTKTIFPIPQTLKDELIKLYLNHRPVIPLNNSQITKAFETICDFAGPGGAEIKWSELKQLLISEGESIAPADFDAFLTALLGANANISPGTLFDPRSFADECLGFEL